MSLITKIVTVNKVSATHFIFVDGKYQVDKDGFVYINGKYRSEKSLKAAAMDKLNDLIFDGLWVINEIESKKARYVMTIEDFIAKAEYAGTAE